MEPISTDILELLQHRVRSFEELEILLLLRRTPGREWEVYEIAGELGVSAHIVEETLAQMTRETFLSTDGSAEKPTWRYAPSAELGSLIDRVAQVYEERRLEVVRLLSRHALERLRSYAARAFADAFLIGRKQKG